MDVARRGEEVVGSSHDSAPLGLLEIALTYFVLYQTGHIHITRTALSFSDIVKMGEPFGRARLSLPTANLSKESGALRPAQFRGGGGPRSSLLHIWAGLEELSSTGMAHAITRTACAIMDSGKTVRKNGLGKIVSPKGKNPGFGQWKDGELPPVPGQKYAPERLSMA